MTQRHRAGILGLGVILLIINSRQRGSPVASVRGVRDVTDRPDIKIIAVVVAAKIHRNNEPLQPLLDAPR